MIIKIALKGIFTFWIECNATKDEIYGLIKTFDNERGKYGFLKKSIKEQKKVTQKFIEYINHTNPIVIYRNSLDLELRKRYMTNSTFLKMLIENGINVKIQSISRWLNNSFKPDIHTVRKIESLLLFSWV